VLNEAGEARASPASFNTPKGSNGELDVVRSGFHSAY
jgi:hypothetical protein